MEPVPAQDGRPDDTHVVPLAVEQWLEGQLPEGRVSDHKVDRAGGQGVAAVQNQLVVVFLSGVGQECAQVVRGRADPAADGQGPQTREETGVEEAHIRGGCVWEAQGPRCKLETDEGGESACVAGAAAHLSSCDLCHLPDGRTDARAPGQPRSSQQGAPDECLVAAGTNPPQMQQLKTKPKVSISQSGCQKSPRVSLS